MTDFETVPVGTMQRLRELEAHVERFREVRDDFMTGRVPSSETCSAFLEAARDAPTTYLARLKAEWQAEAVSRLYRDCGHQTHDGRPWASACLKAIQEYHRQATQQEATPCPDGGKCHKTGETCGDPICVKWHADLLEPQP